MAKNKTKPTKLSAAAFIDALTDPTRRADAKALVKLMQSAAGEKPKMWGPSIIGFGSYHDKYESEREGDMPVIAFSPRKAQHSIDTSTRRSFPRLNFHKTRVCRKPGRPPSNGFIERNAAHLAHLSSLAENARPIKTLALTRP
jgi:hypothetical protein